MGLVFLCRYHVNIEAPLYVQHTYQYLPIHSFFFFTPPNPTILSQKHSPSLPSFIRYFLLRPACLAPIGKGYRGALLARSLQQQASASTTSGRLSLSVLSVYLASLPRSGSRPTTTDTYLPTVVAVTISSNTHYSLHRTFPRHRHHGFPHIYTLMLHLPLIRPATALTVALRSVTTAETRVTLAVTVPRVPRTTRPATDVARAATSAVSALRVVAQSVATRVDLRSATRCVVL
ncbi:hypothetical protein F5Y08DRAFT_253328 [Xylaria arbuscula]|nr:hypothetical protein F5Y08DRAFT_253328 [Xylaria arbuscula]